MPPVGQYVFAEMPRKAVTSHRREWCSAQRIRIIMIAGVNHTIIQNNASHTAWSYRVAYLTIKYQFVGQLSKTDKHII